MKKYLQLYENAQGLTHIEVDVYYNPGDYRRARGYYLSVTPLSIEEKGGLRSIGFTASAAGYYYQLKTVTRKSAKAEKEAEAIAAQVEQQVIERVCNEYNLFLEDEIIPLF